jgi:hypothetical protein
MLKPEDISPNSGNPSTLHVDDFNVLNGHVTFADSSGSVALSTTAANTLTVSCDANDNDETWVQTAPLGSITEGSSKRVIFEARCAFTGVSATNDHFIGLASPGVAATLGFADGGGALKAAASFVGFYIKEDVTDSVRFVYQDGGDTMQAVLSFTPVAGTYYNLAFVYDPAAVPAKRLKVFIDNVEQTTYVAEVEGTLGTDFPTGDLLCLSAGCKNDGTTAGVLNIDIWGAYFEN